LLLSSKLFFFCFCCEGLHFELRFGHRIVFDTAANGSLSSHYITKKKLLYLNIINNHPLHKQLTNQLEIYVTSRLQGKLEHQQLNKKHYLSQNRIEKFTKTT
jgi:hypothetical protein